MLQRSIHYVKDSMVLSAWNVHIDHISIIKAIANKLAETVSHSTKQMEYAFLVIMATFWRMEHAFIQINLN